MDTCGIFEKFDLQNNLIKEYQYWYLLIRKKQKNIGSCVVILKEHAFPLQQVSPEAMAEYATITNEIEISLEKSFGSYLVQHLCLMFVDKHVHFHLLPRYKDIVNFENKEWIDNQSANPLEQTDVECSQETLNHIKNKLLENIK